MWLPETRRRDKQKPMVVLNCAPHLLFVYNGANACGALLAARPVNRWSLYSILHWSEQSSQRLVVTLFADGIAFFVQRDSASRDWHTGELYWNRFAWAAARTYSVCSCSTFLETLDLALAHLAAYSFVSVSLYSWPISGRFAPVAAFLGISSGLLFFSPPSL